MIDQVFEHQRKDLSFVGTLSISTCALSGHIKYPTMTQDSRQLLIQPNIHLQPTDGSEVAACLLVSLLGTGTAAAALAPSGLSAVGVKDVTVHLFYSCGFMCAPQRTGQRTPEEYVIYHQQNQVSTSL